jgi:hypothetical protein
MRVQELLTDNGSAYKSAVHALACRTLGIRHLRTRPRRPQTNGKACALSGPCSPVGSTERSTPPVKNAPQPLTAGSGPTTIDDDTKPSGEKHPSTARTTCSGLTGLTDRPRGPSSIAARQRSLITPTRHCGASTAARRQVGTAAPGRAAIQLALPANQSEDLHPQRGALITTRPPGPFNRAHPQGLRVEGCSTRV